MLCGVEYRQNGKYNLQVKYVFKVFEKSSLVLNLIIEHYNYGLLLRSL